MSFSPEFAPLLTTIVFAITYLGLALGRAPGLRVDRAGIALIGAVFMLATGLLSLEQAVATESIDYPTLALLFGMMVVVAFLRLSGFFERFTTWSLQRIRTPAALLAMTIVLSGVLSAFLINDVVCVALTPLVIRLARKLECDPVPHLIALATAANIGSAATITGNPQNIYIGSHSGIPYLRFAVRLMPVALFGLLLSFVVIAIVYRGRLRVVPGRSKCMSETALSSLSAPESYHSRAHRWLLRKSVGVTLIAIILFFTGLPLELVALSAAAVLMLGRVRPEKVYRRVEWDLLLMFTGLFIVVHAFRLHVVAGWDIENWHWLVNRPVDLLSLVSAGLSNLVSNVPAVLLLDPVVHAVPAPQRESAWLALAMSSTLAGNFTVLGSVANLIVVEGGPT